MQRRRVVTAGAPDGRTVFASDEQVEPITAALLPGFEFHAMWGADHRLVLPQDGAPVQTDGYFPPPSGFRFGLTTIPPETTGNPAGQDLDVAIAELQEKLPGMADVLEPENPACTPTTPSISARADDSYDHQIAAALALQPDERLKRALRDAQPLRVARAQQAGTRASPVDALGVLRALKRAEVQYVLIGELAEVLHGSPLLPVAGRLEIVPRVGQRKRLSAAIAAVGGIPADPVPATTVVIDAPSRFKLEVSAAELVVHPAPPATHGYDDLRRDASTMRLDEDLDATVVSLVDLVRIAEASENRGRVPALRRTLELATSPPAARAA